MLAFRSKKIPRKAFFWHEVAKNAFRIKIFWRKGPGNRLFYKKGGFPGKASFCFSLALTNLSCQSFGHMASKRKRILVTGGAGFIGSALVNELNCEGRANILVADFLGAGETFKHLIPLRFEDYIEADKLLSWVQNHPAQLADEVHAVYHLGACANTMERDMGYLIANNFEYTKQLATWALRYDIPFVYASSAATYGDGSQGMEDSADVLDRLRPLNAYAYSKHLFDQYAHRAGILDRICGLKYFNVFGPNEDHKGEMQSVVRKAFFQIQTNGKVRLFKSYHKDFAHGQQKRDFLYVKDAVKATVHCANQRVTGLVNVGSGVATTWIDLVTPIFEALDRPVQIEFIDMPETLREKYQYFTCANTQKLRSSGSPSPTPIRQAVHDYVKNYLLPNRFLGDENL